MHPCYQWLPLASPCLLAIALTIPASADPVSPAAADATAPAKPEDVQASLLRAYEDCVKSTDHLYEHRQIPLPAVVDIHRAQLNATTAAQLSAEEREQRLRQQLDAAKQTELSRKNSAQPGVAGLCDLPLTKALCSEVELRLLESTQASAVESNRLHQEVIQALQERQDLVRLWHRAGGGSLADFAKASHDLLVARLDFLQSSEERIAVLGQMIESLQQRLELEQDRPPADNSQPDDLLFATALLANFQLRLLGEKKDAAPGPLLQSLQRQRLEALQQLSEKQRLGSSGGRFQFATQMALLQAITESDLPAIERINQLSAFCQAARETEKQLLADPDVGNTSEWELHLARVLGGEAEVAAIRLKAMPPAVPETVMPQPAPVADVAPAAPKPDAPATAGQAPRPNQPSLTRPPVSRQNREPEPDPPTVSRREKRAYHKAVRMFQRGG